MARELNKPCIVGVKNATKILHDGDMVELDGDSGKIEILK
jgi:phosphohistidine swiveling domain-containing protein